MAEKAAKTAPARRKGFFRRLIRLACALSVLVAVALVVGFKLQKQVVIAGQVQPCAKWAWEDPPAFLRYARYWAGRTRNEAREIDRRYRASEKAKAALGVVKTKAVQLATAVKDKIAAQTKAQGPAPGPVDNADRAAKERDQHFGYTENEVAALPAGYYEAYKSGQDELRAGVDAYEQWARDRATGREKTAQLNKAQAHFETARSSFERARGLYTQDARPEVSLQRIQEYLHQIAKDSPAEY